MKLLALCDMHADEELMDRLHAVSARNPYDAVLFCGDFTNRGRSLMLKRAVSLFPKCFAVHGNMDTNEVADALRAKAFGSMGKRQSLANGMLSALAEATELHSAPQTR